MMARIGCLPNRTLPSRKHSLDELNCFQFSYRTLSKLVHPARCSRKHRNHPPVLLGHLCDAPYSKPASEARRKQCELRDVRIWSALYTFPELLVRQNLFLKVISAMGSEFVSPQWPQTATMLCPQSGQCRSSPQSPRKDTESGVNNISRPATH